MTIAPRAHNGQPVAHADVLALLDAAQWAPSAYNVQSWRFVVCETGGNAAPFGDAVTTLIEYAQALIAGLADTLIAVG